MMKMCPNSRELQRPIKMMGVGILHHGILRIPAKMHQISRFLRHFSFNFQGGSMFGNGLEKGSFVTFAKTEEGDGI